MTPIEKALKGATIQLDEGRTVRVKETIEIVGTDDTFDDTHAQVRASDGNIYRIWDNGEVDLEGVKGEDIADINRYRLNGQEGVGSCDALAVVSTDPVADAA